MKVLIHCCLQEKIFNKFYALLAQRLCRYEPQSYKYSFKYTLWDYLKSLGKFDLRQVSNIAKLYGHLIAEQDLPLHFLKVLNFEEGELTKPQ